MPRFHRVLRAVLFASISLAVWTLSRPAMAAPAPLCDDRGATALAPPPALEASDVAIQRAAATVTCPYGDAPLGVSIAPGHRGATPTVTAGEPALPGAPPVVVATPSSELEPACIDSPPAEGVRYRVERPPRG